MTPTNERYILLVVVTTLAIVGAVLCFAPRRTRADVPITTHRIDDHYSEVTIDGEVYIVVSGGYGVGICPKVKKPLSPEVQDGK